MKVKNVIYILANKDDLDTAMFVRTQLDTESLDRAIKAAAQEYLNTDDGRKVWEENGETFNYKAFMSYIPSDICMRNGFIIGDSCVVYDDYNTTLAEPEEQDD